MTKSPENMKRRVRLVRATIRLVHLEKNNFSRALKDFVKSDLYGGP